MQKNILNRTISVGDVLLILPMAGIINKKFPHCTIIFPDNDYTPEVVALSNYVDEFIIETN